MKTSLVLYLLLMAVSHMSDETLDAPKSEEQTILIEKMAVIFDAAGLEKTNTTPSNFHFRVMNEGRPYDVVHAFRYMSKSITVDCVIYEYHSEPEALRAIDAIKNLENIDSIFKDYNFVFKSEMCLVLLRAGCNQIEKAFKNLTSKIKSEFSLKSTKFVECTCGGNCNYKLHGDRYRPKLLRDVIMNYIYCNKFLSFCSQKSIH